MQIAESIESFSRNIPFERNFFRRTSASPLATSIPDVAGFKFSALEGSEHTQELHAWCSACSVLDLLSLGGGGLSLRGYTLVEFVASRACLCFQGFV